MTAPPPLPLPQPGRHEPGRKRCAGCPKTAQIRRMVRGPDGRLYGSTCASKRGFTAAPVLGVTTGRPLPHWSRADGDTLFDQQHDQPASAKEPAAMSHTSTTPSGTRYHHNSDFSGPISINLPAGNADLTDRDVIVAMNSADILAIADTIRAVPQEETLGWFSEQNEDAPNPRFPWQPFFQHPAGCLSLSVWFETKDHCEMFVRGQLVGAGHFEGTAR